MEGNKSRQKLVADEIMHYLFYKYSMGVTYVRVPEITEYIWEKHRDKFGSKNAVSSYVSKALKKLQKYDAVVILKEVGEKGYRVSLTLKYLGTAMYNPRASGGRR